MDVGEEHEVKQKGRLQRVASLLPEKTKLDCVKFRQAEMRGFLTKSKQETGE